MTDRMAIGILAGAFVLQNLMGWWDVLTIKRLEKRIRNIERAFVAPGDTVRFEAKGPRGTVTGTAVGLHPEQKEDGL